MPKLKQGFFSSVFIGEMFKSQQIMQVLEKCLSDKILIRIWYGESVNGTAWPDENDVVGYVGRSAGQIKTPLLLNNSRSIGGGGILQNCIVRIDTTKGDTLYKNPNFNAGIWRVGGLELFHNGEVWGRFKTQAAAIRCMEFMIGERYAK